MRWAPPSDWVLVVAQVQEPVHSSDWAWAEAERVGAWMGNCPSGDPCSDEPANSPT